MKLYHSLLLVLTFSKLVFSQFLSWPNFFEYLNGTTGIPSDSDSDLLDANSLFESDFTDNMHEEGYDSDIWRDVDSEDDDISDFNEIIDEDIIQNMISEIIDIINNKTEDENHYNSNEDEISVYNEYINNNSSINPGINSVDGSSYKEIRDIINTFEYEEDFPDGSGNFNINDNSIIK